MSAQTPLAHFENRGVETGRETPGSALSRVDKGFTGAEPRVDMLATDCRRYRGSPMLKTSAKREKAAMMQMKNRREQNPAKGSKNSSALQLVGGCGAAPRRCGDLTLQLRRLGGLRLKAGSLFRGQEGIEVRMSQANDKTETCEQLFLCAKRRTI